MNLHLHKSKYFEHIIVLGASQGVTIIDCVVCIHIVYFIEIPEKYTEYFRLNIAQIK